MKSIKKAITGLAIAAVMAVGGLAVTNQAHAQPIATNYDPISQWIVLSGLFNPYMYGTAGGTTGGAAMYDPISQWIVLSGLFYPGAYGVY